MRLLLPLLILLGTTACGYFPLPQWLGGSPPEATPTPTQPKTEITFWHWPESTEENTYRQGLIDAFEAENPTIHVTLTYPEEYPRRLRTALGTDRPPDVVAINLFQLPDLVAANTLAPLTDIIDRDQDFYPHVQQAMQVDGLPYCFPQSSQTLALFYNKDHLAEAGLPMPTATWQWEDLRNTVEQVTDAEAGRYGLVVAPDFSRWSVFLYQAGGAITTADGSAMALNSPEAVAAIDFYGSLVLEGIAATPLTLDSRWPGEAFGLGRATFAIEGNWLVPYLAASGPTLNYGIAPLPSGPAGAATHTFSNCLAIPSNTNHQPAAERLIAFLSQEEFMRGWIAINNAQPVYPSLEGTWRATYPQQSAFVDQVAVAREWQLPTGFQPWLSERNEDLRRILGGFIPPEALVTNGENSGNALLSP